MLTIEINEKDKKLFEFMIDLILKEFWGDIQLKFEKGRMTVCKKTESFKFNKEK